MNTRKASRIEYGAERAPTSETRTTWSVTTTTLYNEEFPPLGAEPRADGGDEVRAPRTGHRGKKRSVVWEGCVGDTRRPPRDAPDERDAAFQALADKEGLKERLAKTRMCDSAGRGRCRHGSKCRFAHSLDELEVPTCLFGAGCRFVRTVGGKVVNNGGRMCRHKHPGETREESLSRVGLDGHPAVAPEGHETVIRTTEDRVMEALKAALGAREGRVRLEIVAK